MKTNRQNKSATVAARRVRVNRMLARTATALAGERPALVGRVSYYAPPAVHYVRANPEQLGKMVRSLLDYASGFLGESGRIEIHLKKFAGRRHNDAHEYSTISIELIDAAISDETPWSLAKSYQKMNRMLSLRGRPLPELGLAKCSAVAAALGGNLWVRPKSEKGLSFNLSLPLLKEVLMSGALPRDGVKVRVVGVESESPVDAGQGAETCGRG